jgi:flagellar biosynthesis protein FliQ
METSIVIDWTREALKLALLLGGPLLAVALIVGILVGMAQTATQMHEPVVAQVPRMIAIAIAALVLLPFLIGRWVSFTTNLFHSLPDRF